MDNDLANGQRATAKEQPFTLTKTSIMHCGLNVFQSKWHKTMEVKQLNHTVRPDHSLYTIPLQLHWFVHDKFLGLLLSSYISIVMMIIMQVIASRPAGFTALALYATIKP